ncbi:MAG TPA: hypothetical protein ENH82_20165 [bacterium]|nr:hypothetical protein [bacterium]
MASDIIQKSKHRYIVLPVYFGSASLWALAGSMLCAGVMKTVIAGLGIFRFLILVIPLTVWPARELVLEFSGKGFGANALVEFNVTSYMLFLVWSFVLWCPVLLFFWRKIPRWIPLATHASLLLIVSSFFWKFGNG